MKTKRILTSVKGRKIPVACYGMVYFQTTKDGETLWAPEYSFAALNYILDEIKEAQKHGYDRTIVITGREGFGKSALSAYLATRLGLKDLNKIAWSARQYLEKLQQARDGEITWLDEGGRGLYSRDAMKRWNRDLMKAFMQIRIKRLVSIICIPHMRLLDVHLRNRRVDYWGSVYRQGYHRGYVRWRISGLRRRRTKERIPGHESEWDIRTYWEPLFAMRFPKLREYNGFNWEEYERIKRHQLSLFLDESAREETPKLIVPWLVRAVKAMHEEGKKASEIAELTGMSKPSVYRYLGKKI